MAEHSFSHGTTRDLRSGEKAVCQSEECDVPEEARDTANDFEANATIDNPIDQESAAEVIKALQRVERLVKEADGNTDPLIGRQLGKYKIQQRIGQGGMGTVYRALQVRPVRREVALKIMSVHVAESSSASRRCRERFVAEGQVLASIRHPDIAYVFDADVTERGEPYFVMELADGVPLNRHCSEHALTVSQRVKLVQRVCRAVHRAHLQGVVHRDLKPDNILVAVGDSGPVIKIIDFGIAKILQGNELLAADQTVGDQFVGTPGYMSPEQASGADIDPRADVFSLGVVLFQLLCGSTPINRNDTPFSSFDELRRLTETYQSPRPSTRIASRDPQTRRDIASNCRSSLANLLRECRTDLDWVVLKAIDPNRVRRYATAADFADDLQRVLDSEPTQAAAPTLLYRGRKLAKRNPMLVVSSAALMIGLASIGLFWKRSSDRRTARKADVVRRSQFWIEQADLLRKSVDAGDQNAQRKLSRAATILERTRILLRTEPTLHEEQSRRQEIADAIEADDKAFDFVAALDAARQRATIARKGVAIAGCGSEHAIRSVQQAMLQYGIDPAESSAKVAADRLKALPSGLLPHVIEAFDFWIGETYATFARQSVEWQCQILRELDPDPRRNRLRTAIAQQDVDTIESLAAEGLDAGQLPFSRVQLASALAVSGNTPHSIRILRRAQREHPGSFWVNHHLASALSLKDDEDSKRESLRYFTAAAALRPDIRGPLMNMAMVLSSLGRTEEAKLHLQKAKEIHPEADALYLHVAESIRAASEG